jgi:hypothetical protein
VLFVVDTLLVPDVLFVVDVVLVAEFGVVTVAFCADADPGRDTDASNTAAVLASENACANLVCSI